jgi:hypothetical protein
MPAVVGRVVDDRLLLDLRTVLPGQDAPLISIINEQLSMNK